MKKERIRFDGSLIDDYFERPISIKDEIAIDRLKEKYNKYGKVEAVMNLVNQDTMRMAYDSLTLVENNRGEIRRRKDKAPGIDRITMKKYGRNLAKNLKDLDKKLKKHQYKVKPVLRTHIPKAPKKIVIDGKEVWIPRNRPLSIPTSEDKILQKTIVDHILGPITEMIFTEESFGYRPNKSVRKAIEYIEQINYYNDINYVLVLDNKEYFDSINREKLVDMLEGIIKDKVFLGIVKEITNGKYIERKEGNIIEITKPESGIYQGLIISPVLANLYLHYVMDSWYKTIDTTKEIFMVRYADDIIIMGSNEEDIKKAYEEIDKRFKEYDLTLSEEKKKTIDFNKDKLKYLGFELVKRDKEIDKYISKEKIMKIKNEIKEIVLESLTAWKEPEINLNQYSGYLWGRYYMNYIRRINNKLKGEYETYRDVKNQEALNEITDYACKVIDWLWSGIMSKENVNWVIMNIITPYYRRRK